MPAASDEGLGLQPFLEQLRVELEAAATSVESKDKKPLLYLDEAQVEIQFVVEHSKEGKGGFDLKVVSIGGGKSSTQSETHTLRVTLRPLGGKKLAVASGEHDSYPQRPPNAK